MAEFQLRAQIFAQLFHYALGVLNSVKLVSMQQKEGLIKLFNEAIWLLQDI